MNNLFNFIGLAFLILAQVTILPLNFAFATIFGISSFNEKSSLIIWLVVLAVIYSLFSNQNLGLVTVAIGSGFILLKFFANLLPQNNMIKWGLIASSLVICELSFFIFNNLLV